MGVRTCIKKLKAKGVKLTPEHERAIEKALSEGLTDDQAVRRIVLQAHQNVIDITVRARDEGATVTPVANPVVDLAQWQSRAIAKLNDRREEIHAEVKQLNLHFENITDLQAYFRQMEIPGKKEGQTNDLSNDKVLMDVIMKFWFRREDLRKGGAVMGLSGKTHFELFDNFRKMDAYKSEIQDRFLELNKELAGIQKKRKEIFETDRTFYQAGVEREAPKLVVHHNIRPENIVFADKMGGLAVPSLAVMKEGMSLEGFGSITLIGRENLGDPEQVPIFDADGYTVRFPSPKYKPALARDSEALWRDILPWETLWTGTYSSLGYQLDESLLRHPNPGTAISFMLDSHGVQAWFLKEVYNEELTPTKKDVKPQFAWGWDDDVVEFFSQDHPELNYQWEDPRRAALLKRAAELVERKVKGRIKISFGTVVSEELLHQRYLQGGYVNSDGHLSEIMFRRLKEDVRKKGSDEIDYLTNGQMLSARLEFGPRRHEFKAWVEKKIMPIAGPPRIKVSGKWVPFTLENIVRKMRGKLKGTEFNMHSMNEGLMRALAAHRFKRLEEMRGRSELTMQPKELVLELRDEAAAKMLNWTSLTTAFYTEMSDGYVDSYEAGDAARRAVVRWATSKNSSIDDLQRGLDREGFFTENMPEWMLKEGLEAARDWLAVPVPYFEAKPQRSVKLEEFAGAVIRHDTGPEVRAILRKRGIPYKEYQVSKVSERGAEFVGPPTDEEFLRQAAIDEFTQELNDQGERTLFQSSIGLTSGLLTAARTMPQEKGSAQQMIATLKRQPNVKQEELETVGVEDWAEAMGEITRDQLISFIEGNGVQIQESLYAGKELAGYELRFDPIETPDEFMEEDADTGIQWFDVWDDAGVTDERFLMFLDNDAGQVGVRLESGEWLDITRQRGWDSENSRGKQDAYWAISSYIEKQGIPKEAKGQARWQKYTLPEPWSYGENHYKGPDINHREILLHVPERGIGHYTAEDLELTNYKAISPYAADFDIERNDATLWFFDAKNPLTGEFDQVFQISKKQHPSVESAIEHIIKTKRVEQSNQNYISHAFSEKNIISWIRATDRKGPNGERIFFIEEVQSDLHQAGLTEGYNYSHDKKERSHLEFTEIEVRTAKMLNSLEEPNVGYDNARDALLEYEQLDGKPPGGIFGDPFAALSKKQRAMMNTWLEAKKQNDRIQAGGTTPDMPWKGDAWAELALKRVIRLAAEQGYDQVAWTTGAQQLDRYDISEFYSQIAWDPREEKLMLWDPDGRLDSTQHVKWDELDEYIGAERKLELQRQMTSAEADSQWKIWYARTPSAVEKHPGEQYSAALNRSGIDELMLEDDDPWIDDYMRQWIDENGGAFVLIDANGEIYRQGSGSYQAGEYYDGMEETVKSLVYENFQPTLTSVEMVGDEEGSGLKQRYDKLMVNVASRVLRKTDKSAKLKPFAVQMEGGELPRRMTIESDGKTYYVSALDPRMPTDVSARIPISPRFGSWAEAVEWQDNAVLGYANTVHGFDITPQMRTAAMEGLTLFQDKNRASISFDKQNRAVIRLGESKDLSSFIHELAHMYLEMLGDLSELPDASPRTIDMYAGILKHLGVNSRAEVGRDQHEKFARSFEAYLREGVAPTAELQPLFTTFKGWMIRVYKKLSLLLGVGEELTDEIRSVFDRMVASDEAISQAEDMMQYVALYQTAEDMGVSQETFDAYKTRLQEAHDEEVDKLSREAIKSMTWAQQQWWKSEMEKIATELRKEAYGMQVYKALYALQRGTKPDGSPLDYEPFKLSKESVLRAVDHSKEFMKRLPGRGKLSIYSVEGGVDVDVAAGIFGYKNGRELIRALISAPKIEEWVKAEAKRTMQENHPDPLNSPELIDEATRQVHNEKRGQILRAELSALRKQMRKDAEIVKATKAEAKRTDKEALQANKGQVPTRNDTTSIKAAAEVMISGKKIRDIKPHVYLTAERKAGRMAFAAMERKDYAEAYRQKRLQIMNFEAYRAAKKAMAQAERDQKYLKTFDKAAKRRRMGKAGVLDQIDAILEGIDLRRLSLSNVDRERLQQELLVAVQSGDLILDQGVLTALAVRGGKNWKDFTFVEFSGIRDLVKQLEHMAKRQLEVIINGERIVIQEAVDAVAGSIISNNDKMPITRTMEKGKKSLKKNVREGVAHWLRASSIARILDKAGFGAVTQRIIVPIREAYVNKLIPRQHQISVDIAAIYQKHYSNKELAKLLKPLAELTMGEEMSKADLLVIALNWGSQSNREALLGGMMEDEFGNKTPAYTHQGVAEALARLDARDWAFVQDIWDYEGSFYDEMAEAEKRRRGIAPQKIEAMAFEITSSDGQLVHVKGGYHPLQYDARHGGRITEKEFEDYYQRMTKGGFVTASTRAGSTHERVKNHGMVVRLSLNTIEQNLRELVRDLALGDEVNLANKILTSKEVTRAARNTNSIEALKELQLWLSDSAVGELPAQDVIQKSLSWIRVGFTKSKLAFNVFVTALQLTGVFQTMAVVGAAQYMRGVGKFISNPAGNYRMVMQKSAFMQVRYGDMQAWDKDVADTRAFLTSHFGSVPTRGKVAFDKMAHMYFYPIAKMQSLVDVTTWMAAYEQGMNDPEVGIDKAAQYADAVVERAQTSGLFSDRSGLERGTLGPRTRQGQFVRLWTVLISYMLAKGNIAYEKGSMTNFREPMQVVHFATDMMLLFLIEGVVSSLLYGNWPGDDDDDESIAGWVAKVTAESVLSGIPLVREYSAAKYGSGNTPIGALVFDTMKFIEQSSQGETDEAMIKAGVKVTGTLFHLPASQVNRAVEAIFKDDAEWYEYIIGNTEK